MKFCVICLVINTIVNTCAAQIHIADSTQRIKTIKELLKPYKGLPVFIDLWASWCTPCKDEFVSNPELYTELQKRKIILLYISIDKTSENLTWLKDIHHFKLDGYHIKASKLLRDEITMLIRGAKEVYSIPHYMMFDRNGKLLEKNLLLPDDKKRRYKQIEKLSK